MIRKYLSSDSPSKRPASADRSVRPDIAAEYIFRSPACVQRHTFSRRRGCKKKKKNRQKKLSIYSKSVRLQSGVIALEGAGLKLLFYKY